MLCITFYCTWTFTLCPIHVHVLLLEVSEINYFQTSSFQQPANQSLWTFPMGHAPGHFLLQVFFTY